MSCGGRGRGRGHQHHHEDHHHEHHHDRPHHHHHHQHHHHDHSPERKPCFEHQTFPFMGQSEKKCSGGMSNVTIPSEFQVTQPKIPCVGPIAGGIRPGMRLHVEGAVPPNAKQFRIDFKTGVKDADDIAFHFNPRFGHYVYMNIFKNGKWQKEELGPDKPFVKGAPFKLLFIINKDFYEVHVNGVHHYTFNHRIPLDSVTTLAILGDVSIMWFGWEGAGPSLIRESKVILMKGEGWTYIPLKVSNAISNPAIPYVGSVQGGMKQDIAIVFQGTLPANANRFEINFKTGPSDGDDIAFHYNPRIGEVTALNTFRRGKWETQESAPDKPFTRGGAFIILVVINYEGYEVYVNGLRHCTFKHRIPLEKVSTVNIGGNVSLLVWGLIDSWSTTSSFTELKKITSTQTSTSTSTPLEISHPIINPVLPYVGKIPGGIHQDRAVFFQGKVPADAKGFEINFKTGPSDGDDIAFHYNLRIGEVTALNSFRNGKWETQESASDKPFTRGGAFQMIVPINFEGYEVYVNGLRQCVFKHRIALEQVSTLGIRGDVLISVCGFIYNWESSPIFTGIQEFQNTQSSTSTTITLQVSQPISNPTIPYVGKIPIAVKQNIAVVFQGNVPENANGFEINFKTGPSNGDDIAFHYKPSIGKYTALNSFRNGRWEKEETASDKPFTKGEFFQIIVAFKSEGYEVYANGLSHCIFKHRIPLEKVSTIAVQGDVTIQLIGFVEKWST